MKRFRPVMTAAFLVLPSMAVEAAPPTPTVLPGPADINRIAPDQTATPTPSAHAGSITLPPQGAAGTPAPKNAKNIHFVLHTVTFEHVTVFTPADLKELYAPYIDKKVSLDVAWQIADALTAKYRKAGYFLSRAYVPAQEVSGGTLIIRAVEGGIGSVTLTGAPVPDSFIIRQSIATLTAEKPARLQTLERQLLLLNDIPGYAFQAVLAPADKTNGDEARLVLAVSKTAGVTTLSANNSGSRYIGPYEVSADWTGSLIPMEQTDLSITDAPTFSDSEGRFSTLNATQKITLTPATVVDITAGYSDAVPGYTLKPDNVKSEADNGGIGVSYRLIRERLENLTTRLDIDFRNSATDLLGSILSRDHIRAAQWGVNYDTADPWSGHDYLDVELRHGLPIFNSSRASDVDLSRPDVHPDFTKLQVNYTRLQSLTPDWSSLFVFSGQKASGALYASEEFGYGGTAIGRAYDPSEISGDNGASGSVELHYQSLPQWHQATVTPYAFYDIGKVWNLYPSVPSRQSGASAGPGLSIQGISGFSATFYVAEPLTKAITTPLYSGSGRTPRYAFQISQKF